MARIEGQTPTVKSKRHPSAIRWRVPPSIPLGLALGSVIVLLAAPDLEWWASAIALLSFGVSLYVVGRMHGQADPDPQARGRVVQLERALSQLALVAGYDGLARRSRPADQGSPSATDGVDEAEVRTQRPTELASRRPGPVRDLGEPLPGEPG